MWRVDVRNTESGEYDVLADGAECYSPQEEAQERAVALRAEYARPAYEVVVAWDASLGVVVS